MRYVAAFMLAVLGGKDEPTADDIRAIIESVGVEVDEDKLSLLLEKLNGKNIEEVQEFGLARLATVPCMTNAPEKTPGIVPVTDDSEKNKNNKDDNKDDSDDDDDDEDGFSINLFD